jgi:predicted metal-dependent HD superfamily phosphohydrolase
MSTLEKWLCSWAELSIPASGKLQELFTGILSRYAEPHRFYHTRQHLEECFEKWSDLRGQADHPAEVDVALWFHEAVYDTQNDSNELRSAELAQDAALSLGVDAVSAQRIYDLVMSTRHEMIPVDPDARLIVDTDLSILGADPARFAEYECQVRREYAWVPKNLYRERRAGILKGFLERPYIFSTDLFRARYERQARQNIRNSLEALK